MIGVRLLKHEGTRAAAGRGSMPARDLQELWFSIRRREWKSLVVVPATPEGSALPIAQALGEVGGLILMAPVPVINAEGADLPRIATLVMEMGGEAPTSSVWTSAGRGGSPADWDSPKVKGQVSIIAVDSVVSNPLVLPLALAADAVLICIEIGKTDLASVKHTVELIGRERLLGSVLLRSR